MKTAEIFFETRLDATEALGIRRLKVDRNSLTFFSNYFTFYPPVFHSTVRMTVSLAI